MKIADQIKAKIRIEDLIGRQITLRPSSRGYAGSCPFHKDNNPSFHVYTDTQSYYCFSCHDSGDIFAFTMKTRNLSYREALEVLANEAGIDITNYDGENAGRSKPSRDVYGVLSLAQEYFASCLRQSGGAKGYLQQRKLTPEDFGTFGLGYAPASWDGLSRYLSQKGIEGRGVIEAGLALQNERGMYDRFRGRIMFPVRDVAGRIIAFGGRLIDGDGAKYMNSPESQIYHKRSNLYLLNAAGRYIRDRHYSILCEGYMDALRLHKSGFREAVASLGTSLTDEQARLLKRFSDVCYICYDDDEAGKNASLRGMYILAENNLDVYVVTLPEGKDPDEYLSSHNPEDFAQAMKNAKPLIPYHIEQLRPLLDDKLRRRSAMRELWEGVRKLNPDIVMEYLGDLCGVFGLSAEDMSRQIMQGKKLEAPSAVVTPPEPVNMPDELEAAFCALLMRYPQCRLDTKPEELGKYLHSECAVDCAEAILSSNPESLKTLWLTLGDTEKTGLISRGEIFITHVKGLRGREIWSRVKDGLEAGRIKERTEKIRSMMRQGRASKEEMRELSELLGRLGELKI